MKNIFRKSVVMIVSKSWAKDGGMDWADSRGWSASWSRAQSWSRVWSRGWGWTFETYIKN